ncbi:MAG TPA: SDR family oxidoreductase [Nocardioidaceae bacterium]|nr:SDR family oxidoreductase [Nocardioidaceae bacterium]
MSGPVIVVIGAGPGLGAAVARRFGAEGYDVALVSRSAEMLDELGAALQREGITTGWTALDLTHGPALTEAITRFGEHAGHIDVLHFNPSRFRQKDPLSLTPDELLEDVRLGAAALLTAVQAARPFMSEGARVTATGSMAADAPWNEAASLGVQKAALRNLVRSIDATLRPDGIRAVSVTVNGTLAPGTGFSPDRVAGSIFGAATQPVDSWRTEVPYDG